MTSTRRGYSPHDNREFSGPALDTLKAAAVELRFLLDRGYALKSASVLIGNHHQLSERQRMALVRAICSQEDAAVRDAKRVEPAELAGRTVHIDAFNAVITLEVALSGSPVLACCDGAVRDLAGLRGTYRLIDKTDPAIRVIVRELAGLAVEQAVFWLDRPVSNSGRLKSRILEIAAEEGIIAQAEMVDSADAALWGRENVASSDSVVIDRCQSWVNLTGMLVQRVPDAWVVDFTVNSEQ